MKFVFHCFACVFGNYSVSQTALVAVSMTPPVPSVARSTRRVQRAQQTTIAQVNGFGERLAEMRDGAKLIVLPKLLHHNVLSKLTEKQTSALKSILSL